MTDPKRNGIGCQVGSTCRSIGSDVGAGEGIDDKEGVLNSEISVDISRH